ncbi:hypothetical protein BpHYR1_026209 [Brachionus plicatilis]|uniref:Uncharacterized protein n=1 Tax=Brachionus plicatilis TaxID=10195 RepID=A0A3M7S3C6_BRAPC|nr:hypothetical protein BpHYR1_026209 [Brachionus plicatilis]
MLNQTNPTDQNMKLILDQLARLNHDLISSSETIKILVGFLYVLAFLNIAILMYMVFRIYLVQKKIIDYFQNFLKFHTQVITPSRKRDSRTDDYETDDVITSSKIANDLSMGNIDDYVYDYEYFLNSQCKEEFELPRTVAKASFESSGYSKNNSVLKSKIDRRVESKCNIKRERSSDSISLKMKRSESWDAKNRIYSLFSFRRQTK